MMNYYARAIASNGNKISIQCETREEAAAQAASWAKEGAIFAEYGPIEQEQQRDDSAKHTPTPWSINEWPQAGSDIAIGAMGTPLIAKVILRDVSINEQKANATHIVHCVNVHDGLVEALQCFQRAWDENRLLTSDEAAQMRAALAAVGAA
jgi:hypothetical protein